MQWISETACDRSWTRRVRLADERLPDIAALANHIYDIRAGASLRGVEASLRGRLLEEADGALVLEVARTGERVRLAPLARKVERHAETGGEQAATEAEREACARLRRLLAGRRAARAELAEITGPLSGGAGGVPWTLEVREFRAGA